MHTRQRNRDEAGSVLILFTLFLTLLLAFAAFATEGGRWYLVRAELSKSVDAGALQGARNISNPYASPVTLAQDFCTENFSNGYLGTPGAGTGTAAFQASMVGTNKVQVSGNASAVAILGRILGFDQIPVAATGAAALKDVEIMLILDHSGSMGDGTKMADLKIAACNFVDFFVDTQDTDKMGLISFATGVSVDRPLGINYVTAMKTAINNLWPKDYTNSEDAIDQADGPGGFTDQSALPVDSRTKQVAIFCSDGFPTAFRSTFKYQNVVYDAVVHSSTGCYNATGNGVSAGLYRTDTGGSLGINPLPTGDGVWPASKCGSNKLTTRWYVLDTYPIPGSAPDACGIDPGTLGDYLCATADAMALAKAQQLKDKGISVFAIGIGTGAEIDPDFLRKLASSPDQAYITPTSSDLAALFAKIAQQIKLRLVS